MANQTRKILNKILWKGKSKWLLYGAALGAFIGLFLLLSTLQFYFDVQNMLQGDADPSDKYVQINKKVNLFNTLGVKAVFSEADIDEMKSKPFIESVGKFTANDFRAGASSDMLGFYTELFFESVPKEFLDVHEPSFRWSEGQNNVPVIISKDYLALYNFGFAPSQGLPQVTPSTVSKLNMEITVSGQGGKQSFNGKIVGFSDRINSILVPPDFMAWANGKFGSEPGLASRLILKVQNPLSKDFQTFLKEKNYEVSVGRLIGSQFGILLKLVLVVLWAMGLLILALSMLVFTLNFQLLIAQSRPDITLLLETGHYPIQISGLLSKRFSMQFGLVLLAVFVALFAIRFWEIGYFSKQGFELKSGLEMMVWLVGVAFCAALLLLNIANIRRSVTKPT
ncbi:MAG: hypothetical protein K9J37_00455 [Saprospiraceae bacterium]|nr:hypothetical protein [Saprospiraceae bacterium]MCF8248344.1 hypothetical protein [Saprospiraceae bacterium]MCF8280217.1 hypothetical protein [Bacteroidales bacterium]MCF8309872.1 hypothetical protein [Saprospiraceae bacterium]MCF8438797.1 hypothetical protein [Saprospiraceae bacterium]